MKRTCIGLLLGLTFATACLEQAEPANNDGVYVPPATTSDSGAPGPGLSGDAGSPGPTGPVGNGTDAGPSGTTDAGATTSDAGGSAADAGGATGDGGAPADAGSMNNGPSAVEQIIGTGKACSTYGLPMNGKCGGIYCGIEPALLEKAFQELTDRPNGCNPVPSELACSGITARTTAACARKIKSGNPLASNAELRPKIEACVFEEAEIKAKMPSSCLSCYLDSAVCSGDKCLIECLGGDSPTCDKCRLDKGCSVPVAACTGFPNPL